MRKFLNKLLGAGIVVLLVAAFILLCAGMFFLNTYRWGGVCS